MSQISNDADLALIKELAAEAARAAKDAGLRPDSYAFKSFCSGCFRVIARSHPSIAGRRQEFLEATGAKK